MLETKGLPLGLYCCLQRRGFRRQFSPELEGNLGQAGVGLDYRSEQVLSFVFGHIPPPLCNPPTASARRLRGAPLQGLPDQRCLQEWAPTRLVFSSWLLLFPLPTLPIRTPPVPAAHGALDQTLNATLYAIREPFRPGPLLLRFGVDQRNSSFKFTTSALNAFVNSLHVLVCFS